MIVRLSRARLRRDLKDAIIDSSVEHFETIAERYEDLPNIGLEPGPGS